MTTASVASTSTPPAEQPGDVLPLAAPGAVVERLQARQAQLAAEREERASKQAAGADAREDVAAFMASWATQHAALRDRSNALQQQAADVAAAAAPGLSLLKDVQSDQQQQQQQHKAALLEAVEALSLDVAGLEQATSAASYFLPAYEVRSCTGQLAQLRAQLAEAKACVAPKRRFAFSKAVARAPLAAASSTQQQQQQDAAPGAAAPPPSSTGPAHDQQQQQPQAAGEGGPAAALSVQDQQLIAAGHGFAGLRNQVLVASAQQLAGQGFVLHDLQDCTVFLLGSMRALRLQHLCRCAVYAGPVAGAAFADACSRCVLMLAAHQVRLHRARACDIYLRARSRPVIEASSGLRFAPWEPAALLAAEAAPAGSMQALLKAAQLAQDGGQWRQVDDFGWVKASASPHWCLLPDAARQPPPARLPDGAAEHTPAGLPSET